MVPQSLCHFLQGQLTEYYRMVAVLESQMSSKPDGDPAVREDSGLTLRRLDVWIDEWRLRMRMMSACVENCKGSSASLAFGCSAFVLHRYSIYCTGTKGGALVSLIHANTNNGDPFVRSFTDQLLEEVCDHNALRRRDVLTLEG
jgi:gamma-tubulin complex component 3